MSLRINSFGSRLSFELVRDDVTVGGLAYTKSGGALATNSSARAHVHGEEILIKAEPYKSETGFRNYDIKKGGYEIGELEFNWRGRGELELYRRKGGKDRFYVNPKGLADWWFLVTDRNRVPMMNIRPTTHWRAEDYHFDIEIRTERYDDRVLDELAIYMGFAANVYMARKVGVVTKRRR